MKQIKCKFCGSKTHENDGFWNWFECNTWKSPSIWNQSSSCKIIARLQKRIQRLKTAGDEIVWWFGLHSTLAMNPPQRSALKEWYKAKEAKP